MPLPGPELPTVLRSAEQVPFFNRSGLAAWAFPFRLGPPDWALVTVVKGTFDLIDGAPAKLSEEQRLPCSDQEYEDAPGLVRYPSDFVPKKPKVDLVVVGHVFPGDNPAVVNASVRIGTHTRSAAVFGDRSWKNDVPTAPQPFQKLPMRWDRALGGVQSDDNPKGRGFGTGLLLPNIERPDALLRTPRDRPLPMCFAPVPQDWKPRRNKLGTFDEAWVKNRWPAWPADFDWSFFQAASPDLQLPALMGNEEIAIAGMRPGKLPPFRARLPGVKPMGYGWHASGQMVPITLVLDTVWIDMDALKLVLLWRGHLVVQDEEAPDIGALTVVSGPLEAMPSETQVRSDFIADVTLAGLLAPPPSPPEATPEAAAPRPAVVPSMEMAAALGMQPRRAFDFGPPGDRPLGPPTAPPQPADASSPSPSSLSSEPPGLPGEPLPAPPPINGAVVAEQLARGESLAGADLTGADLRGLDLSRRDLQKTVFARCNLAGVRFQGSNLREANLAHANLAGADFSGADLTLADLARAELGSARFDGANLLRANLEGAHAPAARFTKAKGVHLILRESVLTRAVFDECLLKSSDFSQSKLDHTTFLSADPTDARFYDVLGSDTRFDGATMANFRADRAKLKKASFEKAKAGGSSWQRAELPGANFLEAELRAGIFVKTQLEGACLNRVDAREACFRKASLRGALLMRADLMQASLESADLTGADLRGANLYQLSGVGAKLASADLRQAFTAGARLG